MQLSRSINYINNIELFLKTQSILSIIEVTNWWPINNVNNWNMFSKSINYRNIIASVSRTQSIIPIIENSNWSSIIEYRSYQSINFTLPDSFIMRFAS